MIMLSLCTCHGKKTRFELVNRLATVYYYYIGTYNIVTAILHVIGIIIIIIIIIISV